MTLAEEIVNSLSIAIEQDKLVLPTLPKVALNAKETAEDPDATFRDLADVISQDVSMSARIIKIVNCPLMRINKPIDNIHDATGRLGIKYTSTLVIGLAIEQMFRSEHEFINKTLNDIWKRSIQIAATSYVYAKRYTNVSPDKSMLAGLVHLIGALPILTHLSQEMSMRELKENIELIITRLQGIVGHKILSTWDFPADLVEIPITFKNAAYDDGSLSFADIVIAANIIQSHKPGSKFKNPIPCLEKMEIFEDFDNIRTENKDQVAEVASLFML